MVRRTMYQAQIGGRKYDKRDHYRWRSAESETGFGAVILYLLLIGRQRTRMHCIGVEFFFILGGCYQ